ncbi:MAG: hypothetical protein ACQESG_07860 [Nanobdellota archaeon]
MKWIRRNRVLLILFVISTSFFVYQHSIALSWDFNAYVLNAQYWFADGMYFEPLRPPLMPVLLGMFSFFGWRAAEYIFIILTSFLFMYSSARLARSIGFDAAAFYALSLNGYVLMVGLINGTELLSLVFLELSIAYLIERKAVSGFFLGLSAVARYTGLALFPMLFLHLRVKRVLGSMLLFGGVLFFWFAYNLYAFGNLFTSIADQYANNILYRQYLMQPVELSHFLKAQNILIPFFLIGLGVVLYYLFTGMREYGLKSLVCLVKEKKVEIVMLFLLSYSLYSYANIPLKDTRYLFTLVLPTLYFSYIGLGQVLRRLRVGSHMRVVCLLIFVASLLFVVLEVPDKGYETPEVYTAAIDTLDDLNRSSCSVMSNSWVMLNYLGRASVPSPWTELVEQRIEAGQLIVLFRHVGEPAYLYNESFIHSLPILYADERYVILGRGCSPIKAFDASYLEQLNRVIVEMRGHHINQNPCFVLFHDHTLLERSCNLMNLNGFTRDEYRRMK